MLYNPRNYQEFASSQIIEKPYVGLFLDMGLGKTISTLTAVAELLHDRFDVDKVLVIAPLRVAEDTWTTETDKWNHTQYLQVARVLGNQNQRLMALRQEADVWVINRENVEWLVEHYGKEWPFDMVVIDESSSFKSSKAKRFRALRKVRPFIKRIIELTGTPQPNGLMDLWPQIYLLDQGERLGKTLTGFRDRYFQPGARNGSIVYEWKPKPGAWAAIMEKISDICVSMSAKDWLEMPERIDNIIPVKIPEMAWEKYKQLEKDLVMEIGGTDVVAGTAAVLSNKLLQMANGAVYDENGQVQKIHDAKLEALKEIIELAGQPVLVFYWYKHDRDRLMEHLKAYKVKELESSQDIKTWNAGKTAVLLAHPAAAGHGLNLQAGGNIIAWFGLTWSLELYQQANARLHRQGQENAVIIHHLVAQKTVDEDVMNVLTGKAEKQDAMLVAVKARIEAVRRATKGKGAG